ncbi:repeat protein [Bifidobacterium ramosum]|uniref:Repeat protein n=1 Tax=Bifidobacterium ramosum TaxID=1798158 RepID=A0A6L4X124_9BIFI|nr:repeat protein [Bifidobacterium ramosum]
MCLGFPAGGGGAVLRRASCGKVKVMARKGWRRIVGAVASVSALASLAAVAPSALADETGAVSGVGSFDGAVAQSPTMSQAQQQTDAARKALKEKNDKLQAEYDARQQSQPDTGAREASQVNYGKPSGPVYIGLSTSRWDEKTQQDVSLWKPGDNSMVPYINVTVKGLESGVEYCTDLSQYNYDGVGYSDGYSNACAKASGSTATFKIYLSEVHAESEGFSGKYKTDPVRLYAHVAKRSDIVRGEYSESTSDKLVVSDKTGVLVNFKKLSDVVSISNLRVEDIGAQTVGLKYDYKLDAALKDKVAQICLTTEVYRGYSLDVVKNAQTNGTGTAWGAPEYCGGSDVVSDNDTSADADAKREDLHKIRTGTWSGTVNGKAATIATYTYQSWTRFNTHDLSELGGKLSGTVDDATVTMLNPSTKYGNWGGSNAYAVIQDMIKKKETHRTDPWSSLQTYLQVKFTDGTFFGTNGSGWWGYDDDAAYKKQSVPEFTTKSLAASAESSLTAGNANNVNGSNGGVATAKSKYRIYIDNLSKECKALANKGESMCSWAAYIYSSPTRLSTPDGQNALVRKEPQSGRYYVDVNTPAGYQGTHKIALFNQDAKLQGWTSVRFPVSKFDDVTSKTPHAADIQWLAGTAITEGWKNKKGGFDYRGMNSVTRQDMAAFLYRLAGSPSFDVSKAGNPFRDVTSRTPHYKEILWLASTGVTTGWAERDGSRTFRGMNSVVRQDMAAFLRRLADYEKASPALGADVAFGDVSASTPHSADIAWLAKTGVTTGWTERDGSRTYRGMRPVVRQDMAAFLHRMNANVLK